MYLLCLFYVWVLISILCLYPNGWCFLNALWIEISTKHYVLHLFLKGTDTEKEKKPIEMAIYLNGKLCILRCVNNIAWKMNIAGIF